MSRKTTARRAAIGALAASTLLPGFALGIAQAAATDPAVVGLNVTALPASSGGSFAITGKNLSDVTAVKIGKRAGVSSPVFSTFTDATFLVVSPTKIVAKVGALTADKYDVVLFEGDDIVSSDTTKDDLYLSAVPAITAADGLVDSGPASAGQKLTVKGSGFLGTSSVVFVQGSVEYPVKSFKVTSDSVLEVVTGELPAGANFIKITNPAGAGGGSGAHYQYAADMVVTKATPAVVDEDGGQMITISGSGLKAAAANGDVKLVYKRTASADVRGTVALQATDFMSVSNLELVFKMPAAADYLKADTTNAGVDAGDSVEVVVANGSSSTSTFTGYKPVNISYTAVPKGTLVKNGARTGKHAQDNVIVGRNLQGAKVKVGNADATVLSNDGTTLKFRTPTITSASETSRPVYITTKTGTTAVKNKLWWNVAAPSIDSAAFDTASGKTDWLVITGNNLASVHDGTDIKVDGVALTADAKIEHLEDDVLRVHLPQGANTVQVRNEFNQNAFTVSTETVAREFTTVTYDAGTQKLKVVGVGLKGLPGSALQFADGDAAVDATATLVVGESTSTEAVYQLLAPVGTTFVGPDVTGTGVPTDQSTVTTPGATTEKRVIAAGTVA